MIDMLCEHANECPQICPCPSGCYCKTNTCKVFKLGDLARVKVQDAVRVVQLVEKINSGMWRVRDYESNEEEFYNESYLKSIGAPKRVDCTCEWSEVDDAGYGTNFKPCIDHRAYASLTAAKELQDVIKYLRATPDRLDWIIKKLEAGEHRRK